MAITFGATTGTRLIHTWDTARGGSGDWILTMFWIRPTTLTGNRYILQTGGTGNTARFGIKIHATLTGRLTFEHDFSTTDPAYSFASNLLTTNKWWFIAFLWGVNTTPTAQLMNCWYGDQLNPPRPMGISETTAPSGTPQSSVSAIIGNNIAGTAPFQGDIARLCFIVQSFEAGGLQLPRLSSNSTALSTPQHEFITNTIITPYWNGTKLPWVDKWGTVEPVSLFINSPGSIQTLRHDVSQALNRYDIWQSGSTAQLLVATSSVTTTNWNGAITTIDETTPSDADFMYSTNNTVATLEYHITDPTPPAGITPTIRYRIARTNAGTVDGGGNSLTVTTSIIEGTTVLVSDSAKTPDGTWTQYDWTPTLPTTVNWNDVRLRFVTTASGGSPATRRGCGLSWGVVDIPTESAPTVNTDQPTYPLAISI